MPLLNVFQKMRDGLTKTRKSILGGLDSIFKGFSSIDDDLYDELEELLIAADMGAAVSADIIGSLRRRVKAEKITEPDGAKAALLDEIASRISGGEAFAQTHGATSAEPAGAGSARP
ncbi:MAG: signal recognition particle receptor subunit alpha, partial [Defluviitaleaceae bacterium]|nr:signal recognition particle receptor subunit alpha [Defluviitaleaceae bacterium]